jgi:predicted RNase H-like HicB family nuclease
MKYTAIVSKRSTGEYIALVPAFYNGYEYARTYSYDLDELKELLDDLVLQEMEYRKNYRNNEQPSDITIEDDLTMFLPFNELEEGENYSDPFVMTVEAPNI